MHVCLGFENSFLFFVAFFLQIAFQLISGTWSFGLVYSRGLYIFDHVNITRITDDDTWKCYFDSFWIIIFILRQGLICCLLFSQ
jgi:hypothetical protein